MSTFEVHAGTRIDEALERVRRRLPHRPTAAELPALRAVGALIVDIRPVEQRTPADMDDLRFTQAHGACQLDRHFRDPPGVALEALAGRPLFLLRHRPGV